MARLGASASTSSSRLRMLCGVKATTSTSCRAQAAPNQLSRAVLPLPRGPSKTTLCGGAEPATRSARQRDKTSCCASRPRSAGGNAPSPGRNRRGMAAFIARAAYASPARLGCPTVLGGNCYYTHHTQRSEADPQREQMFGKTIDYKLLRLFAHDGYTEAEELRQIERKFGIDFAKTRFDKWNGPPCTTKSPLTRIYTTWTSAAAWERCPWR